MQITLLNSMISEFVNFGRRFQQGYRSIGFSPMNKTPRLAHEHDEYLEESIFLRGVEIYAKLIAKLGDMPEV